jgi:aldehyde:ferredoxin oxidoreductase
MAGGYVGKILEIDLTTKKIQKRPLDMNDAQKYIGGRGLGDKMLWDRTKVGGSYLDPDNPMCFVTGPLSGLTAPCASRLTLVTRSAGSFPKSNPKATGILHTNTGGRWAPELKFAGYDALIVTGASSTPVGIMIENDRVEILPAKKHWGLGCYKLEQELKKDFGVRAQSLYIGPGGENLVRYASINNEIHRALGRGGPGAVMGSKKLKFITVRGANGLTIGNMAAWKSANQQAWKDIMASPNFSVWRRYGTSQMLTNASDWGAEAVYNFKEGTYENADALSAERAAINLWEASDGCYMCPIACMKTGVIRTGRLAGATFGTPEYETGVMMGANCGVKDFEGMVANTAASDDYGLCTIAMGNVLGFCMECYEKDVISASDLDGIKLKWGDTDAMLKIQKKVAHAEGCGKLLGRDLRALVAAWGKGSDEYAMETKGVGFAAWNLRAFDGFEMTYATANRGADHLTGADIPTQHARAMNDSLGICHFPNAFIGFKSETMKDLLNAAAGYNLSIEEFWKAAERIYNLERSFNVREGFDRKDDTIPARPFKEALSVGAAKGKKLDPKKFDEALDKYYADRGWSNNGVPTNAKLKDLGLDFVSF